MVVNVFVNVVHQLTSPNHPEWIAERQRFKSVPSKLQKVYVTASCQKLPLVKNY